MARNINTEIPDRDGLNLPPVLKDVVMAKRGLVLFVGGTGFGHAEEDDGDEEAFG